MARWQGKIAADIQESVPDWTPFVQPIGLLPDDVRLSPIIPHGDPDGATGPSGQPWPRRPSTTTRKSSRPGSRATEPWPPAR